MQIDPNQIQLSPEQQIYIAQQAERLGKPWPELLSQFVPVAGEETQAEESAYDTANRLGLIGGIKSGYSDLATNPKHMEGFGQ